MKVPQNGGTMATRHRSSGIAFSLGALAALALGAACDPARAEFVVTMQQQGSDVVATGSGTLNLTDLTFEGSTSLSTGMDPAEGILLLGSGGVGISPFLYGPVYGPTTGFGTGSSIFLNASETGDLVGIFGAESKIWFCWVLRVCRACRAGGLCLWRVPFRQRDLERREPLGGNSGYLYLDLGERRRCR